MQFERKLNKIGDSTLTVTIPSDLVKYLNLTPDTIMLIEESNNIISLRKKD
jgi:antitoxin component of MazEF toxin-antitoxin module